MTKILVNGVDVTIIFPFPLPLPETFSQRMLLFDGLMGVTRIIKLRPRQPTCAVCGDNPTITRLIDYELFCGSKASDKSQSLHLLDSEQRISCQHYKAVLDSGHAHLLIDVREPVEYEICCLDNATSKLASITTPLIFNCFC